MGICRAAGTGNKTIYFVAIIITVALTGYYAFLMKDIMMVIAPVIMLVTSIIILHFVRVQSEKEMAKQD